MYSILFGPNNPMLRPLRWEHSLSITLLVDFCQTNKKLNTLYMYYTDKQVTESKLCFMHISKVCPINKICTSNISHVYDRTYHIKYAWNRCSYLYDNYNSSLNEIFCGKIYNCYCACIKKQIHDVLIQATYNICKVSLTLL